MRKEQIVCHIARVKHAITSLSLGKTLNQQFFISISRACQATVQKALTAYKLIPETNSLNPETNENNIY